MISLVDIDEFPPQMKTLYRFLSKINKEDKGHDTFCWIWTGERDRGKNKTGAYGQFKIGNGRKMRPHRWSVNFFQRDWENLLTPDETVDHLCHVRLCVNPTHLEVCTRAENKHRGVLWEIELGLRKKPYLPKESRP